MAESKTDSPAHEWFNLDHIDRPFSQRSATPKALIVADNARQRIGEAIRSSDATKMINAAAWLDTATDVSEVVRRALRIELAISLLDEASYAEARELLDVSKPELDDPLHRLWLQKSIMAYRRLGEQTSVQQLRNDLWRQAEDFLLEAEQVGYVDSEIYGIWGGLLKRRLQRDRDTIKIRQLRTVFSKAWQTNIKLVLSLIQIFTRA